jgi:class 3 adenylate cyclase
MDREMPSQGPGTRGSASSVPRAGSMDTGEVPPLSNTHLLSPYILEAPDPAARFEEIVRVGGILFVAVGVLGTLVTIWPNGDLFRNADMLAALALASTIAGLTILALARLITPLHLYVVYFVAIGMISAATYSAGFRWMGFAAMIFLWQASLGFSILRTRWLVPPIVVTGVCFAIVLGLSAPFTVSANAWIFTMGTILVTGVFFGLLIKDLHTSAVAERMARNEAETAKRELSEINEDLEQRVKAKVDEVERLSDLRRLVSSHIADALLGSERALDPHRQEIAVFFIDLRNFTSFAMDCDPEEVIQVLNEFYGTLGLALKKADATVGSFQADGVMAYFNDPVPVADPALCAVDMALDLRAPMNKLVEGWERRGFDLHFGIGIALGYATMGMVGFDGRQDYTAIGTVVNLASRLCDEAGGGEILIDRKVRLQLPRDRTVEDVGSRPLKGFRDPVPVFRL